MKCFNQFMQAKHPINKEAGTLAGAGLVKNPSKTVS